MISPEPLYELQKRMDDCGFYGPGGFTPGFMDEPTSAALEALRRYAQGLESE